MYTTLLDETHVISKFIDAYCKLLSYLVGAMLAVMVVLVFGNVFMRYALNSGFTLSEELSRWLFVWVTFLGAVVALRSRGHLGTDMLVGKLSPAGKKSCMGLSLLLMLYCMWLLFKGALDLTIINLGSTSAVMEVSMAWFYASGMVFALLGTPIVLLDLWRLLTGQTSDENLVLSQESEDKPHGDSPAR